MNDDDFAELFRPYRRHSETTWDDVGRELHTLGQTLGDAFRAAWERQPSNALLRELQDAVRTMVDDVTRALDHGVASAEAEQTREQMTRLADTIRAAAERSTQELRPELLRLLRQANAELRRFSATQN